VIRIGSLFSGYGGLEQGVQQVLGGSVAWHSDIDPGACKILAHRYPDVPNLGDITAVDWAAVEPVDVLTGGFPCQDVSSAGKRKGLNSETRSGLWAQMVRAIDELRPPLVVAENVRGLLSACATSELEPCPRCLGDESQPHRSLLRALGRVLGDLADLGYDARWGGLRAADAGAPHGRFRVFVVAWPQSRNADSLDRNGRAAAGLARQAGPATGHGATTQDADLAARGERRLAAPGQAEGRGAWADAGGRSGALAADAYGDAIREQPVALARRGRETVAGHVGTHAAANTGQFGRGPDLHDVRERQSDPIRGTVTDTDGAGRGRLKELHTAAEAGHGASYRNDADGLALAPRGVDWGVYGSAVQRWERTLGRVAPPPTARGKNGQPRLSPAFVEWMQGLPTGWVTDVPSLSRNEMLKALGNGVVPQQAAAALRLLLPDVFEVAS